MKAQKIPVEPVAVIRSPFEERFGIPRQPGLVPAALGEVLLLDPYDDPAMLQGLAGFSHIWLTFLFDRCVHQGWRSKVRPPRLGGNAEVGGYQQVLELLQRRVIEASSSEDPGDTIAQLGG